jgi:hypothetical protein
MADQPDWQKQRLAISMQINPSDDGQALNMNFTM